VEFLPLLRFCIFILLKNELGKDRKNEKENKSNKNYKIA